MSLRISGSSSVAGTPIDQLLGGECTPGELAAFKLVRTVLRNLINKGPTDDKYRTLKTDNVKVAEKLLSQPRAVNFLCAVGFANTGISLHFAGEIRPEVLQESYGKLEAMLTRQLNQKSENDVTVSNATKKMPSIFAASSGKRSIKAKMRAKEETEKKRKMVLERKRRKQLLKGFDKDKEARKQPGWKAKLSGANRGAAPSAQASEGANLTAY